MSESFEKEQKLLIDQVDTVTDVIDSIARYHNGYGKPEGPLPDNLKSTLAVATDKLQQLLRAIKVPSDANNY